MSISKYRARMFSVLLVFLFVSACSGSDDKAALDAQSQDSILQFVPADTPFVFAKTGAWPDDLMDKMGPQIDASLVAYHQIIRSIAENAYAQARNDDEDVSNFEKWLPIVDELGSLMTLDGLGQVGINRESAFSVYGVGLLPVLRLSLSDGALLEAEMSRLEEQAGERMEEATIDGYTYRYAGDDSVRLIVAILEDDLVVSMVPSGLANAALKQVLGLTLPAESIAVAGTLSDIARDYGFTSELIGLMDFERLAATFLDEPSGINAELLNLMQFDHSLQSDVCKAEFKSMVTVVPRTVMGYTEFNASRLVSKAVVEVRQDIAAALPALSGSVPGLGDSHGGLFSFGMSIDLLKLRDFYSDRLDALEDDPYECETLQSGMREAITSGREMLNAPVPPVAYGFNGFLAIVDELEGLDLASGQPPTSIEMRLLVAIDNAEQLLSMGAMFVPEIAAMGLKPDGELVKLEMPQIDAMGLSVHAAMTESVLGLAIGDGAEEGLKDLLATSASGSSPVLYMDMDAGRYYAMSAESMFNDVDDLASIPEIQDAIDRMTEAAGKVTDRINFAIHLTERGIEIDSEITLHD